MVGSFFFIIYALLFCFSSVMVVGSTNPIHSVLFLVLCFFNAGGLLILTGAEFMAMMFLIIYVGAIAVLFLFVVMMLNIKIVVANFNLLRYLPVAGLISLLFLFQIASLLVNIEGPVWYSFFQVYPSEFSFEELSWTNWFFFKDFEIQPEVLGNILYTYSYDLFILCGIVLFIAMIGAILLTLRVSEGKRQYIGKQIQHVSNLNMYQ